MKKYILFFAFAGLAMSVKSQITLIHTFNTSYKYSVNWDWQVEDCDFYVCCDSSSCFLYNWDLTLYKEIKTMPPKGYKTYSVNISKQCFNNDNRIELLVVYQLNTYDIDKYQTARIIDEDGNKIYDFGYSYQFAVAGFQKYNNELRMTLLHYKNINNSLSTSFEIYKCAGTGGNTQSISHIQKTAETKAFPNPATNTITLTYNLASGNASEIQIFNSNGQLVKIIPVGPHFNEVQVDVTAFPKGIYFYKCEGATNQFVVQ